MIRPWMARSLWVVGVVVVVGLGGMTATCSAPPPASTPPPQTAKHQPLPPPPTSPPPSRPVAKSACRSLYVHYEHETARIPYPACLPIRTLLPIAAAMVKRYDRLSQDAECVFMVNSILARFFVHRTGPGIVPPPAQPTATRSRR